MAASLVHGQTLHSFLGMGGAEEYRSLRTVSETAKAKLSAVLVLMVNEVSMLGRRKLAALNRHLKAANDEREKAFGGVMMIFCGDLF